MNNKSSQLLRLSLTCLLSFIWLINGLYCKVLNLVPRHELIVARILGPDHSRIITFLIGVSEVLMAVWIITRIKHRLNAVTQIIIIAVMNTIEFFFARDLLLFGKWNALFALLLISVIYLNEFRLAKEVTTDRK